MMRAVHYNDVLKQHHCRNNVVANTIDKQVGSRSPAGADAKDADFERIRFYVAWHLHHRHQLEKKMRTAVALS